MKYSIDDAAEKEYLEHYNINQFERPSIAADIITFALMQDEKQENIRKLANRNLKILLINRAQFPYKGGWALPGGFVQPHECVEAAALRELHEETGIDDSFMFLSGVYSEAGRDPRGWIISNSFISLINADNCSLRADTDAWEAAWFSVKLSSELDASSDTKENVVVLHHHLTLSFDGDTSASNISSNEKILINATVIETKTFSGYRYISEFVIAENDKLAFDHAKIIVCSILKLRKMIADDLRIAASLLPDSFTLAQLQETVEKITDKKLLSANFRRKISEYVEETGEVIEGMGHRPAQLFHVKP